MFIIRLHFKHKAKAAHKEKIMFRPRVQLPPAGSVAFAMLFAKNT